MDTIIENQRIELKEKIKLFFSKSSPYRKLGFCPTKDLLALTLDKWSLFCLYYLGYYDIMRFNELKGKIPGISSRMLSTTLKRLEENGMISRTVFPEVPPRVEYQLTQFGQAWALKVIDLSNWFIQHHFKTSDPSDKSSK